MDSYVKRMDSLYQTEDSYIERSVHINHMLYFDADKESVFWYNDIIRVVFWYVLKCIIMNNVNEYIVALLFSSLLFFSNQG